ncbi:TRAP transporter, DctM subunit [Enhydrobacter aerosaccus]|uniref:TRAP transporter large permease protein n=1 Tax=Enhydrobacter aerosaccus TaxID=225324 RepID=A0A1T4T3K4_9HYPH|nr:TRAP transporter large permease [Enhydrobacter aerosaccus]SKA34738.1 TRAP transporter, DctM subunit [Enhydrobacter aerosaccus]
MSAGLEVAIVLVVFLGLLAAGMAIPFAIGVPAIVYLLLHGGVPALKGIGLMSWGSMNNFALTAIPLFILMAEIMQHSGLSFRIYRGLGKLVCVVPGGLLQTNIAGCALFAAISGSSVATAAAIGSVALPQLVQRGYDRPLAAGSLAAGGTLGILIPPSIAMIVYGTFTETSVSKLFMAGIVPGLLLTALFMAYVLVKALLKPEIAPRETGPRTFKEFMSAVSDLVPFAVVIGGTMGSLYFGWVTPTEAAAVGCAAAFVVSAIWGHLGWKELRAAMVSAIMTSGNILLIVYTAFVFSYAISVAGVGESLTAWMVALKLSRLEFFLALFVLYTVLGCLVESLGMIVVTVPLLYPVLLKYGIDPVWFGIILVLFIELGQISPPIGINLFVIQSIWNGKLSEVVYGTIPFHLIMFVLLVLLVFWPEIALWLPQHMKTG